MTFVIILSKKAFTMKIRSASSRVNLGISKTLSDHWKISVGFSKHTVIVEVLINSGPDNCSSLALFPRNRKQPNVLRHRPKKE